ncbi:MAG TPA: copper-binding protein [bacterium]|jgi:Cu/Ag efflux protein CusF|nr:copper-binding protein [bacterium]
MVKKIAVFVLGLAGLACMAHGATPKQYHVRGVVMEIKNQGQVLVIQHEAIPGLMGAMTMPFELSDPGLAKGIKAGDTVRFTMVHQGDFWPIIALKKVKAMKAAAKSGASAKAAPVPTATMAPMNMQM